MFRHRAASANPAPFPGMIAHLALRDIHEPQVFLLMGSSLALEGATGEPGIDQGDFLEYTVTIGESGIEFLVQYETMGVVSVFLYVNSVNDQVSATETDVSADLAGSGGTTSVSGLPPNATRYFWVKLVDEAGNETISPLGSHTTSDLTPPTVSTFTVAAGTPTTSAVDCAFTSADNDAVQTNYLLLSATQTTAPSASAIKTNGVALAGNAVNHTVSGLSPGVTYYAWLMARDAVGNESAVTASTPGTITTSQDVTPPLLNSFSIAATTGSEETSVSITISVTDT